MKSNLLYAAGCVIALSQLPSDSPERNKKHESIKTIRIDAGNQSREIMAAIKLLPSGVKTYEWKDTGKPGIIVEIKLTPDTFGVLPRDLQLAVQKADVIEGDWAVARVDGWEGDASEENEMKPRPSMMVDDNDQVHLRGLLPSQSYLLEFYLHPRGDGADREKVMNAIAEDEAFSALAMARRKFLSPNTKSRP